MVDLYRGKSGLISIVIPTYNHEKYICDALDGLKKQTYRDIEVIIVDDCSTDNTEEIVSEWHKKNQDAFNNFIYFKLPRNCDEWWALNIGFAISRGEYICIHGADDISHEEKINKQVNYLIKNPNNAVVGTGYKVFTDNINNTINIVDWLSYDSNIIERNYKETLNHCVCHGTLVFKKSILEEIIGFRKSVSVVNDVFFIMDIINHDYIVGNINENLYYCRKNIGSKSEKINDKNYIPESLKKIKGRVSIVLPVNNSSSNIIDSLESISSQTYNNIELIIVDDLENDNTEDIIKKWYSDYKNKNKNRVIKEFIYCKLPRKIGFPWIYNIGSYLSKGEYIAFHNDSGRFHKYKIQKQVKFLKDNFFYSVVGTNYNKNYGKIKYDEEIEESYKIDYMTCVNINTIMMRADVINETAGLNKSMLGREDFEFIYRLISNNYRIQNLEEILYYE